MSILQHVIKEYGISESSKPLTDKTDKRVNSPDALTDKTDKRASVSSVSDGSEGFETRNIDLGVVNDDELGEALEDDWDEVSNDPAQLEVARMWVTEAKQVAAGIIPDRYTQPFDCKFCGPVFVVEGYPLNAQNCPWCFYRIKSLPILSAQVVSGAK